MICGCKLPLIGLIIKLDPNTEADGRIIEGLLFELILTHKDGLADINTMDQSASIGEEE